MTVGYNGNLPNDRKQYFVQTSSTSESPMPSSLLADTTKATVIKNKKMTKILPMEVCAQQAQAVLQAHQLLLLKKFQQHKLIHPKIQVLLQLAQMSPQQAQVSLQLAQVSLQLVRALPVQVQTPVLLTHTRI